MTSIIMFIIVLFSALNVASINYDSIEMTAAVSQDNMSNGPYGGWIYSMASGIDDNSNVIAATSLPTKALWRSSDGGSSWEWTGISGVTIYDVCAASPSTFYAGTQNGLLVSYDNGENWSQVPSMTVPVNSVGVSSTNPDLIFAGVEGYGGFRRSTDGGATWGDVVLEGGWMCDMAIDPQHPDTLYIAVKGLSHSLYRSTDGGDTWTGTGFQIGVYDEGGVNLLVGPFGTGETILLSSAIDLYISWDYGSTWYNGLYPGFGGLGGSDIVSDGENLFATYPGDIAGAYPSGVIESTDGGHTWTMNSQGTEPGCFFAACLTSKGVLVGHTGGLYISEGLNDPYIVSQDGIGAFPTTCISYNSSQGILFAGGDWGASLWKSTDGGNTWTRSQNGLTSWDINDIKPESDQYYQGHVMYVIADGILFRSNDAGDNWFDTGFTEFSQDIVFDPDDPDNIWIGSHKTVYHSTDGGETWTAGNGFQGSDFYNLELVELENGNLRILAGGNNYSDIYWSDDNGSNYTRIPFPYAVWEFSSRWGDEAVVWAATSGGVYMSLDRGITWDWCTGFPGQAACVLGSTNDTYTGYFHEASSTWEGLWWSPDQGENWMTSDSMCLPNVNQIAYADTPTQVFAALYGYGVKKVTNDWMGVQDSPHNQVSISASPNPLPAFTVLEINCSDFDDPSIDIYDSAGRIVTTLRSNNGTSYWTPEPEIPSGLYHVSVNSSSGGFQTTKVVVLR